MAFAAQGIGTSLEHVGGSPIARICVESNRLIYPRRVEKGRLTGAYWQPIVSLPRSSNRTCPFRASGFPTDFTTGSRKPPQADVA
jgi:hypothetical protein